MSIKMRTLSLGYSPCPNDTFIFYALVHGKIDTGGLKFKEILLDVETLNLSAMKRELDITKVSYNAFGNLRDDYCLLRSGGALGRGCGPLVVASKECEMKDLKGKTIAIPGELTTAYLLLQLYDPDFRSNVKAMPFHEIMGAVKEGKADAGLIIHEGRFTYSSYGLKKIIDLGAWWEKETDMPIPLGCIIAERSLGIDVISKIERLIRESVQYAMSRPEMLGVKYIKEHSRELDDSVIDEHIKLYVNDYSIDLGDDGIRAVRKLLDMAEERGIIKKSSKPVFV
ncbi:MAG: 1,4-dihydroxy-6-naphthoate synthase [Nitrospirae bacterium GWF2_44_13]|nr:MAG: 1,4-dihydroxy-6-naphthoate synthase [Nitrospirae bacterium GWF2_44_13]OGW63956.1 MAG: 1,4-dihydroxy-6-naphthoate synthase [Nitrospirae bacterium RIFOXYA2_FULL_44_9]